MPDETKQIYDIAMFITQIVGQYDTSPYELVLTKAIKTIKVNAKNADKILSLLDKLEIDKLSRKANTYTTNGRESEYQSNKEMYYSVKSKALFCRESYDLCLVCCSEALSTIEKFHHDNNIWIESRIALCHGKLGNTIEAIKILKELSNKKSHWSILANIGDLYVDIGDMQNAIFYMSMAALTSDPPKMKVSLYQKIALLLNSTGEKRIAYHHMLLSKSNREKEQWTIPLNMQTFLNSYEKDNPAEVVNLKILKDFWLSTIITALGEKRGVVTNINSSRKIGFVSCGKDSYFFTMSSVIDNYIKQGDKVRFCLIDSFDSKKNKPSKAAAYIKIDK